MTDWERIDWPTLQRALMAAIVRVEGDLGRLTRDTLTQVRRAVEAAGGVWTEDLAAAVQAYSSAIDEALRAGIVAAITPIAAETVPAGLRDAWIAERAAEAFDRRWPDGLTLSERVWRWKTATRAGVQARLSEGIQLGRAVSGLLYDLQREIEAVAGAPFARATTTPEDWARRLADAARANIRTPSARTAWDKAVSEARAHIDTLVVGGTRRQADVAFDAIRAAVDAGRADLVDTTLQWWLYDRQLYSIKRVARTEMATAYHRATLDAADDDPDVTGYLWRLSASHPVEDICDWFAGVDFGLGEGVWPKDQVPREKAHPSCLCALTPTTRKMRKDGKRGERDLGDFLDQLSPTQRERIAPKWAQELRADGVEWSAMMRPDGRWLDSEAAVRGRFGDGG